MCPPSILTMIILATMLKEYYADPCSSYSLISGQYKRSSNYTIQSTDIAFSDNFLSEGWYRFDSLAGNDMVTWAPSIYQCGTIYPIWMRGTLPTSDEGEVNRTACIVGFYGNCSKTLNIRVKHCGEYNVYHLVPVPQTSTGYCIGENTHCPLGQSSISGFTPCVDVVPVNTNPAVNASLENKITNITGFKPVEPVFKCLFYEPDGSRYWYDTYWYINTDTVKVVESQPYQSNQSWLYPEDWVQKYDLNMVVKCSVRVRHKEKSIPGHHNYSEDFQAGMFPSSFSYHVREGETISIKFSVTVPVGCIDQSRQDRCQTSIFILTPEYQSSSSSCQNFSKQGDISFGEKGCGIIIESSTWWKERILNVTGKIDGLINQKERNVFIRLGLKKTINPVDISGVWNNYTMPDIKIFLSDEDKKLANKVCFASTDPRMGTFDGVNWTASLAGEFVMYRDIERQIHVHALFSSCIWNSSGEGPCSCGIAIRVENSLYAYRTCAEISYRYGNILRQHENVNHICDNRHIVIEKEDKWTKITLPTGAIVKYWVGDNWLYHIYVTPSIFDEDNVEGMCGNPNNNASDDFLPGRSPLSRNDTIEFQKLWRVDMLSEDSLFGVNTKLNSGSFKLLKYCDCASEVQSNGQSIFSHYTANCSITTPAILCSQKTTRESFASTCDSLQNRFRRDGNFINDDSDDVTEVLPLTIDPNFDPNFIPPTPNWKNNWTESVAREYCKNLIVNNPARIECQKYIPMKQSTDVAIEDCVLDIRDSGTTEFSSYTMDSINQNCFEQIKKYEIFHEPSDSQGASVVQIVGQLVCLNNCSNNGDCKEGVCNCSDKYVGTDCSHEKSTPPSNLTLPEEGLCKTSKRACAKTNIFGFFVTQTVFAKLDEFQITNLGRTKTLFTYIAKATYINPTVLRINFPTNYRKKRSPSKNVYASGFYISLSYGEKIFSESLTLVIYNDLCYSCSALTVECNMTSSCSQNPEITQKPYTDKDETFPPLIISLCVVCVLIIGTIIFLIVMKRRHTGHFSPWCVDMKKLRHLPNHPPVQRYDTINLDLKKSTSQNYETLKPPVVGRSNAAFDG